MQQLVRLADGQTVAVDEETGEVIEAEVIEDASDRSWEERVESFISRERRVLSERFKNAREVAEVGIVWGEGSIEEFARAVGVSRSTAYAYRAVWQTFGNDSESSTRPDNLYWRHYELAARAGDPRRALDYAADESLTTRQFEHYLASFEVAEEIPKYTDEGLPSPAYEDHAREMRENEASEVAPVEHRSACPNCSGRGWIVA